MYKNAIYRTYVISRKLTDLRGQSNYIVVIISKITMLKFNKKQSDQLIQKNRETKILSKLDKIITYML